MWVCIPQSSPLDARCLAPEFFKEHSSLRDHRAGRTQSEPTSALFADRAYAGPEYISIVAAEARRPRVYIKTAFKTVYFRFGLFFIGGALAVGIVCNSSGERLTEVVNGGGGGTAAASPYVISMQRLGISVFPDIVNALMLTSIFSAGNTYTYAAVRSLYGMCSH